MSKEHENSMKELRRLSETISLEDKLKGVQLPVYEKTITIKSVRVHASKPRRARP